MHSLFFLILLRAQPHPKWKENGDWNAGGNCIPIANYRVQVEGHFILPITDGVCVAVTALAQSSSLPKSA